ncbi:MAG: sigma-54 dependent transcriptional regulator [Thermodesulfovibrionales bacterium]
MKTGGKGHVLIVDDEPNALKVLSAILSDEGYDVQASKDVDSATKVLHKRAVDAIITDLKMPGKDGMQFFEYIAEQHPDIPVIFLTAYGTVESAVSAMTRGAFYYFIKPPDYPKLKGILARAVEQRRMKEDFESLKTRLADGNGQYLTIGNTPEMRAVFETIEAVKDSASSVLICGETGTGKELIARELHYLSKRKDMPFVAFNCSAIPRELVESELFGFEKGAFTGAITRRIGRFEEAAGGTVLLDEIGELELPVQSKLLRVLQEREVERLGSNQKNKVEFRLISSTNRDLKKVIQDGNFRDDLFYRINVVQIDIPPLRQRKDDIPILVAEFVKEFCTRENKVLTLTDQTMGAFLDHPWPGNVRQLKNIIERAVVLAKGDRITLKDLPEEFNCTEGSSPVDSSRKTLKELELEVIRESLQKCHGNKSKAAKMLGISRKALYKRLEEIKCIQ